MAKKQPTTKEEPSFEQAMEKLDSIVRRLEQGGESLDEALAEYAEAIKLMKLCHKKLEKVERRIEILSGVDAQGNPITEPLDLDDDATDDETPSSRKKKATRKSKTAPKSRSGESELF